MLHSTTPSPPRALFVFGNSLTDTGEANYLTHSLFRADFSPNGIDALPASGRHSNGRVVTDFIAEFLGIPTPPVYLSHPHDISKGVSFATSGAGILDLTFGSTLNQTASLSRQLQQFESLVQERNVSKKEVGSSLFLVVIGNNDILGLGATPVNTIPQSPNPLFLRSLADAYASSLQRLFSLGARRFLFSNIPDLGSTPVARTLNAVVPSVAGLLTETTRQFNALLAERQKAFQSQVQRDGGPSLCIFDSFASLGEVISNSHIYGFEETQKGCCGPPPPLEGLLPCGVNFQLGPVTVNSSVCQNRDGHIFWDYVHPTEKVHKTLADWWWKGGSFTDPSSGCDFLRV